MSNSRLAKTNTDNLIANLRCEIGEIISSWVLMRDFIIISNRIRPENLVEEIENKDYNKVNLIVDKFKNDIISRLSELGVDKDGQINFYFASKKLNILKDEVAEYEDFIKKYKFRDRRNQYISHKTLPPTWEGHRAPHRITYKTILRGIAKALIIMKKIDSYHLGPVARQQWFKMRKKRYDFSAPVSVEYLLLPYIR